VVTISGTGFVVGKGQTTVKLGKKPLKVKSVTSDTIVVQLPDKGIDTGAFTVSVKKRGTAVSAGAFEVVLPTKILQMTPSAGPPGTVVTLKGQGFGSDPKALAVTFLGFYCSVVSVSSKELKIMVPEGLSEGVSGKFQLMVTTGGIAESPKIFKVTKAKTKKKAKPK